ncbi:PucR family transcriptional regulator, partial [Streptomyces sp. TRM76130]|nr:PucR family transcriptional regulator [Streptomyces sp. TRM76130]
WHAGVDADHGIVLLGDDGLPEPVPGGTDAAPGVRIGVGSPVDGLAAVGDARRLADTALAICPAGGGTVRLAEHLPAALVVSSP